MSTVEPETLCSHLAVLLLFLLEFELGRPLKLNGSCYMFATNYLSTQLYS